MSLPVPIPRPPFVRGPESFALPANTLGAKVLWDAVAGVKRDPELWKRQFVLAPMRAMLAGANRDILAAVEGAGYPDVTIQHLNVLAQVPRDEGMRMSERAQRLSVRPGAVAQIV